MTNSAKPINELTGIKRPSSVLVRGSSHMEIAKQIGAIPGWYTEIEYVEWAKGPRGFSTYELWTQIPGNEDKTVAEFFDFLGFTEAIQAAGVQASLDAAVVAVDAAAAALAASEAIDHTIYALKADSVLTGVTDVQDRFLLSGTLSPAQITANQNNYNPTNLALNSILRLDLDAARSLTGLAGGAAGRLLLVFNISAFILTLKDEDAASDAGNRFALETDRLVQAGCGVFLAYDGVSSRWREVSAREVPLAVAQDLWTATSALKSVTPLSLKNGLAFVAIDAAEVTGSTVAPDMTRGFNRSYTLTQAITLSAPTGLIDGQTYIWKFKQDGTGTWGVTLNSIFQLVADAASPLTTANKVNYLIGTYDAAESKIRCNWNKAT